VCVCVSGHLPRTTYLNYTLACSLLGGSWGLFGLHTVPAEADSIILTEGEYDAMAVHQVSENTISGYHVLFCVLLPVCTYANMYARARVCVCVCVFVCVFVFACISC